MSEHSAGLPYGIIDPDYARFYTQARLVAWMNGYALTLHGSFTRDLDLVAVPWISHPRSAEQLAAHVRSATKCCFIAGSPFTKPQGRLVWTFSFPDFGDPRFVDLSVFLPIQQAMKAAALSAQEPE